MLGLARNKRNNRGNKQRTALAKRKQWSQFPERVALCRRLTASLVMAVGLMDVGTSALSGGGNVTTRGQEKRLDFFPEYM